MLGPLYIQKIILQKLNVIFQETKRNGTIFFSKPKRNKYFSETKRNEINIFQKRNGTKRNETKKNNFS
jgi:hypothetical protein